MNMLNSVEQWARVEKVVTDNATELRALCTSGELHGWAVEHGLAGPRMWPIVRTELHRQLGIDYELLHARELDRRATTLRRAAARSGAVIELCAAGSDARSVYAVCTGDGWPVVCRPYHDEDRLYRRGDQLSADMSAAEKAVWLAGRACAAAGIDSAALALHVATAFAEADILDPLARRWHLALDLDVRADSAAVQLCREPVTYDWHDISLSSLVREAH